MINATTIKVVIAPKFSIVISLPLYRLLIDGRLLLTKFQLLDRVPVYYNFKRKSGWGGRVRTYGKWDQNPLILLSGFS